jgi:hypothetical protein
MLEGMRGQRRRGSIYVALLGTALIVAVIGLSALSAVRVRRAGAQGTNDLAVARFCAQSAIEMGFHWIESDPAWRDNRPNGVWAADRPIGDGTFTLEGTDPDGLPLNNSEYDPLVLTGTGVKGGARYKLQVRLLPQGGALTCLEVSLHANNDLIFETATVNGNQIISANNTVTATGSNIYVDVEAVNAISGGSYWGTQTPGITPRTMPDPATVFDDYIANGTPINYSDLPTPNGYGEIVDVVISPNSNPYGTQQTNAQGIYVISCMGSNIGIERCRIVGTLVLLNAGASSAIMGEVNWQPAVSNYPALLVGGSLRVQMNGSGLLQESVAGVNYNPPGTPYLGSSDLDINDSYPSVIKGLAYISGDVLMQASPVFEGVVVVGNTLSTMSSPALDLTYQPTFRDNPPPGFGGQPVMILAPASWRQVVD